MKRKILFLLSVLFTLAALSTAYAENVITCTAVAAGNPVVISGQITNVPSNTQVTILVSETGSIVEEEDILYINQLSCNPDGTFKFEFNMPDSLPYGNYVYKIGSNANTGVFTGTLEYTQAPIIERCKFIDADVNVTFNGFKPSITGTVYCTEGKTIALNITNTTDGTVIANDTITSDTGIFNLNYTLPNLVNPKVYTVTVSCTDSKKSLADITVTINSKLVLISLSGTAATADNVEIEAQMQSVNTDLINKSTIFKGTKTVSADIPNIMASAAFHLTAQGYETIKTYPTDDSEITAECIISGETSQKTNVYVNASTNNYSNKIFKLTYPSDKLTLTDACCFTSEKNLTAGQISGTNINILQISDGAVYFTVEHDASIGNYSSGLINGFEFSKITDDTFTIECVMSER